MSHLIQSLPIPGYGLHCVKHGATTPKWRTLSFLANMVLSGAEDADQWVEEGGGVEFEGLVTYGTCCLWKATVRFFLESAAATYTGEVFINGISVGNFIVVGSPGEVVDIEVDLNALGLMGRACGNLWEIEAFYSSGDGDAAVTVQVIDVTFGPPV